MTKPHGPVPHPEFIGNLRVLVDGLRELPQRIVSRLDELQQTKVAASGNRLLTWSEKDEALELCRIAAEQRDRASELARAAVLLAVRNGVAVSAAARAVGTSANSVFRWIEEERSREAKVA